MSFWTIPLTIIQGNQELNGMVQGSTIDEALAMVADWLALPDVAVQDVGEPFLETAQATLVAPYHSKGSTLEFEDVELPYGTATEFKIPVKKVWIT